MRTLGLLSFLAFLLALSSLLLSFLLSHWFLLRAFSHAQFNRHIKIIRIEIKFWVWKNFALVFLSAPEWSRAECNRLAPLARFFGGVFIDLLSKSFVQDKSSGHADIE